MLNSSGTIMFVATAVGASTVLLTADLISLPTRWLFPYLIGTPVAVCLLAGLGSNLWERRRDRAHRKSEPDGLKKFVVSVEHISRSWYEPLELSSRYLEKAQETFEAIISEVGEHYDADDLPRSWRYKIASEIASDSLRIADSVLSQLRAGHPDTAMGITRQLLELSLAIKVVALDKSGQAAERYQDYDEADYLRKSLNHSTSALGTTQSRLESLTKQHGFKKSPAPLAWIIFQDGKKPEKMEDVIEYVADCYDEDQSAQKFRFNQYMHLWDTLNKWEHMSKSASRRKLGIRTSEGYLRKHLVEKSNVGLDTPLSISTFLLDSTLITTAYIAYDLTSTEHNAELRESDRILKEIQAAIDSVDPELVANDFRLRWKD